MCTPPVAFAVHQSLTMQTDVPACDEHSPASPIVPSSDKWRYLPWCQQMRRRYAKPRRIWRPCTQQWPRPGSSHHTSGCQRRFARTCLKNISKIKETGNRQKSLLDDQKWRGSCFGSGLTGLKANETPRQDSDQLSSEQGNEEVSRQWHRRLGVVPKSLRQGRTLPWCLVA